jgi:hypothetical protein
MYGLGTSPCMFPACCPCPFFASPSCTPQHCTPRGVHAHVLGLSAQDPEAVRPVKPQPAKPQHIGQATRQHEQPHHCVAGSVLAPTGQDPKQGPPKQARAVCLQRVLPLCLLSVLCRAVLCLVCVPLCSIAPHAVMTLVFLDALPKIEKAIGL